MKFIDTETYKEILETPDKTINVPYYEKSNIIVTEDNIEFIIDVEVIEYEKKLKDIQKISDFPNIDIKSKIEEKIKPMLGGNYLKLNFAELNSENVDYITQEMENSSSFAKWLVS